MSDTDYRLRRVMERIGMDLDKSMQARGLTITDVAKATKLTRECVAQIMDGTAEDIDLFTLVDVFYACGYRIQPELARATLMRQRETC